MYCLEQMLRAAAPLSDHLARHLGRRYRSCLRVSVCCAVFVCRSHSFLVEIGLFHPLANVDVSSSVAGHARSRIVNLVCDMTNRRKMKVANASGSAVVAAAPLVSLGDIENIMAKWKFRCLVSGGGGDCNDIDSHV